MSLIPRIVAAIRRCYQPEAMEGGDLQSFSETLNPEQARLYNSFRTVFTESKRKAVALRDEDEQIMAASHGETVLLPHVWFATRHLGKGLCAPLCGESNGNRRRYNGPRSRLFYVLLLYKTVTRRHRRR